jgi:hypothetical protein
MPYGESFYWDSSVWLAWLRDEKRPGTEMEGVADCLERVRANEVLLMTGDIMRLEAVKDRISSAKLPIFEAFCRRRNVRIVNCLTDPRIGSLLADIKSFYRKLNSRDGRGEVTDFDATHLATAIHYKATAFHTFDNGGKGSRGLLGLNGDVAGYPLVICKPPLWPYKQMAIEFPDTADAASRVKR